MRASCVRAALRPEYGRERTISGISDSGVDSLSVDVFPPAEVEDLLAF